jgi:membrane-bound inhibitor of C-type lysozyme
MESGVRLAAALMAGGLACLPVARADGGIRADYLCKGRFDAVTLTAFFFNAPPSAVVLLVGESARRLPQLASASGARFGSGRERFWVKGDAATWQLGATPAYVCESVSPPGRGTAGAVKRP